MENVASKYNKREGGKFSHQMPEGAPFKKLANLEIGKTIVIRGLFINTKSQYGDNPVALADDFYISLPGHLTETVKHMLWDVDLIDAINRGEVGIKPYSYDNNGKTCYSITWVDVVPTVSTEFPNI